MRIASIRFQSFVLNANFVVSSASTVSTSSIASGTKSFCNSDLRSFESVVIASRSMFWFFKKDLLYLERLKFTLFCPLIEFTFIEKCWFMWWHIFCHYLLIARLKIYLRSIRNSSPIAKKNLDKKKKIWLFSLDKLILNYWKKAPKHYILWVFYFFFHSYETKKMDALYPHCALCADWDRVIYLIYGESQLLRWNGILWKTFYDDFEHAFVCLFPYLLSTKSKNAFVPRTWIETLRRSCWI